MNSYPAGQVVPLPPPVGSGLGTGLTGSAGLVAPPLHMPGSYTVMPQYRMGLNTQLSPTMLTPPTSMLTPPTTMLTPPTTMLTPPTTMLTPPTTMLTPPTTMLTPPTTPIGANRALPVHISPAARITPMKPVSPVLPATPATPGLVKPVSPAMPYQVPFMPTTFISPLTPPGNGLVPMSQHPMSQHPMSQHPMSQHPMSQHPMSQHPMSQHPMSQHPMSQHPMSQHPMSQHPMSQHPMLLPANMRTAAAMNLNSTPHLLTGSRLQQSPAVLSPVRQPVPLANGLVPDPRLVGVNYTPQPHLATINAGTQSNNPLVAWVLVQNTPTASIARAQIQPGMPVATIQSPLAANSHVLLPQPQPPQPLATNSCVFLPQAQSSLPLATSSQVLLPQLRTVQPALTARSQAMLPQLASAMQPGSVSQPQTVLLVPAQSITAAAGGGLAMPVTAATLMGSGSQFVLQQPLTATAPMATNQGRLQPSQVTAVPIATTQGSQIVLQPPQIPAGRLVSQPTPPSQATAIQNGHHSIMASTPPLVTDSRDTAAKSHATIRYYHTPVLQSGLPGSDTTSLSASSSNSSL